MQPPCLQLPVPLYEVLQWWLQMMSTSSSGKTTQVNSRSTVNSTQVYPEPSHFRVIKSSSSAADPAPRSIHPKLPPFLKRENVRKSPRPNGLDSHSPHLQPCPLSWRPRTLMAACSDNSNREASLRPKLSDTRFTRLNADSLQDYRLAQRGNRRSRSPAE